MQPRPYVIVQAFVAALSLSALGLTGVALGPLAGAVGIGCLGAALALAYRRQLATAPRGPSPQRAGNDRLVARSWFAVVLFGVIAWLASEFGFGYPSAPVFVRALAWGLSLLSVSVFVSSLVDWYWILPRVTGLIRPAPWESPGDPAWTRVTRIWLLHRALATLAFSAGAVLVPVYMAIATSGAARSAWGSAAGVLLGAVVPLNQRLIFALNPPVRLGDVLETPVGPAYVLDVALEGARVRVLGTHLLPRPWWRDAEDRVISLDQLGRYPVIPALPLPAEAVRTESWVDDETEPSGRLRSARIPDFQPWIVGRIEPPAQPGLRPAAEASFRQNDRRRRGRFVSVETTGTLVGTVLVLAAVAAQLATVDAPAALIAAAVVGLGLVTAGMVRLAVKFRRHARRRGAAVEPLSPSLQALGAAVERQHALLRENLGRPRGRDV